MNRIELGAIVLCIPRGPSFWVLFAWLEMIWGRQSDWKYIYSIWFEPLRTALIKMARLFGVWTEEEESNRWSWWMWRFWSPWESSGEPRLLIILLLTSLGTNASNQVFFACGLNQGSAKITTLVNNVFSWRGLTGFWQNCAFLLLTFFPFSSHGLRGRNY